MPRKEEEAHYVGLLLSRLGMRDTEPAPSERPDFLVDNGGRIVGIEATGIVRRSGSSGDLKLRERFQEQVVQAAGQIYDASDAPSVSVWVRFLSHVVEGDPKLVAAELAQFVARNLPDTGPSGRAMKSVDWTQLPDTLQAQLTGLTMLRGPIGERLWTFGWGTFPEVAAVELQGEIVRKEADAAKFKKRYEELWLLIYATGRGKPEDMWVSDDAKGALYPTLFDRVFFLDARGELLELDVTLPNRR